YISEQNSCIANRYFFTDSTTTGIYTLSLHDALPILNTSAKKLMKSKSEIDKSGKPSSKKMAGEVALKAQRLSETIDTENVAAFIDRKSTRLNSSHVKISYAVFCLKKKNNELCDRVRL